MPTLPLYTPPPHPDRSHVLRSPGASEWWYFDAEEERTGTRVIAKLCYGDPFDPAYLRAYSRYRRNPTSNPPPLPSDFSAASLTVYENGIVRRDFTIRGRAQRFTDPSGPTIATIARSTLAVDSPGLLKLTICDRSGSVAASLNFRSLMMHPLPREQTINLLSAADYRWIIAGPSCEVSGSIALDGENPRSFIGRGYRDHHVATAPVVPGLRWWFWGRVLLDQSALAFQHVRSLQPVAADEVALIESDGQHIESIPVQVVRSDWSARAPYLLRYPRELTYGSDLRLTEPRVIDRSPFSLRLIYRATTRRGIGEALCEFSDVRRLRWPVVGRIIERRMRSGTPRR